MRRNIAHVLLNATQKTLEEWGQKIKGAVQVKQQELFVYEEKKRQLLPQLIEAHNKGVSAKELGRITGLSHATISRWIKEAKGEKLENVKETSSEKA